MTPEQRKLARCALGLPNIEDRPRRNRYLAKLDTPAHAEWADMEARGFAIGSGVIGHDYERYRLTEKGVLAAISECETLCTEDFPGVTA